MLVMINAYKLEFFLKVYLVYLFGKGKFPILLLTPQMPTIAGTVPVWSQEPRTQSISLYLEPSPAASQVLYHQGVELEVEFELELRDSDTGWWFPK